MRNRFILAALAVALATTVATSQDVINPQTDASKLTAGTLPAARLPALTGDVTSSAGSAATTLSAGSASNLNAGTLPSGRMPALTGDVTMGVGTTATTLAAGSASNLNSGTLPAGRLPAFSGGDVTSSAGSAVLAIGATKVTSAMLNADVFSTAHSWGGVQTFTAPILGAASATNVAVTGSSVPANGIYLPAANALGMSANSALRFEIASGLGRASAFDALLIAVNNALEIRGSATTGLSTFIDFDNSADTQLGNITCNQGTASCTYNSGSDIRGKPHRAPIIGASATIDALRVYNFDFPENPIRGYGVAAQEAVDVLPSMVTCGRKSNEDDCDRGQTWAPGSPDFRMWMVDNAKAVPFLIADAQETHKRIAELERIVVDLRERLNGEAKRASLRP